MNLIERLEKVIVYILVVMLFVAVVLGTVELGRMLIQTIVEPPFLLIEPQTLFLSFGFFLIILIGFELLKLLKLHLSQHRLRPDLVIEVAIIAVCNKVVTLDPKSLSAGTLVGLAALLLGLAAGFYVFSRTRSESDQ